jgi:hypothetical protein
MLKMRQFGRSEIKATRKMWSSYFCLIIGDVKEVFTVRSTEDDRLCGLVASVEDYKHRGPGFDSRALIRIFLRELGLERGPLSLVIG